MRSLSVGDQIQASAVQLIRCVAPQVLLSVFVHGQKAEVFWAITSDRSMWLFENHTLQLCSFCLSKESNPRPLYPLEYPLEDIRRGCVEHCVFCALLWDAFETWNEHAQLLLDQVKCLEPDFTFPSLGLTVKVIKVSGKHLELTILKNAGKYTQAQGVSAYMSALCMTDPAASSSTNLPSMLPLGGDTSSADPFNTLQTWLETCDQGHMCVSPDSFLMPKRILQIVGDSMFLREDLTGQFKYA